MALVSPVSDLIGMCVTLVRAFLDARNDNPHSALDESLRGLTPSSAAIEEKHTSGHVNTYDPTPAVSRTYAFTIAPWPTRHSAWLTFNSIA